MIYSLSSCLSSIMMLVLPIIICSFPHGIFAQSYSSYHIGKTQDTITYPKGGVCMMGGAREHDGAMQWFLNRADGGDILILRASGSDGYNRYMYEELGITLNSIETIVFKDGSAANESYIHDKIAKAEGIWFAGGDQWNYISYWRNTSIDSLINDAIHSRNVVIGGTSAGMAILGQYYYAAEHGTVTSDIALNNPYDQRITVDSTPFLQLNFLQEVITDTHYDPRNRKGRHTVFLARAVVDYGLKAKGIACNERTAVCIDENGLARVFGDYPNKNETAYFIQINCEIPTFVPENCRPSSPLEWKLERRALWAYKIHGTNEGTSTFDLNDWQSGQGGTWEHWYIENGILHESAGSTIDCSK